MKKTFLYIPAGIAAFAILPLPIEFYTLIRVVLCGFGAWVAYDQLMKSNRVWVVFAGIAILFNPIIPIYLYDKGIWVVLDLLTAGAFFWIARKSDPSDIETD